MKNRQGLGGLLVRDFIDRSIDHIERVEKHLSSEGMSVNKRCNILCDIMERGIDFGIKKGAYIDKSVKDKVEASKERKFKKWFDELIYSVNEEIEVEMVKNKYKK